MAKYSPFETVDLPDRTWPAQVIDKAPIWCSVDLRDGNQALPVPMSVEEKVEMFHLLVEIGFKEIEIGFPSASQIDFDFVRRLIDEDMVPDDVYIQVLTQSRDHLIRRTFESLQGAKNVILHLYNATSKLQRKVTFDSDKEHIKQLAVNGAELVRELIPTLEGTNVRLQYSPESFSDTETDYALEVCEAVMDVWQPTPENKIILNLPDTVEWVPCNKHADQIEWFCRNMKNRDSAIISTHTHNDRGTGIAACELALMAGGERVEGTLFGNGERTGNLDIVTVALNRLADGIDPGLDFSNIPRIRSIYERTTRMTVPPRQPYSGELVFTAFSGSHQDAIKKGMDLRNKSNDPDMKWEVPYLLIDPRDIGRTYESIVRINSQSGKGGVAHVMYRDFSIELPKSMQPDLGAIANHIADRLGRELTTNEIYDAFREHFLEKHEPLALERISFSYVDTGENTQSLKCNADVQYNGVDHAIEGTGNGPISAFVHAMENAGWRDFRLTDFHEHSVGTGADTEAMAYVQIESGDGALYWGAGQDSNIDLAGTRALISAFNRSKHPTPKT